MTNSKKKNAELQPVIPQVVITFDGGDGIKHSVSAHNLIGFFEPLENMDDYQGMFEEVRSAKDIFIKNYPDEMPSEYLKASLKYFDALESLFLGMEADADH